MVRSGTGVGRLENGLRARASESVKPKATAILVKERSSRAWEKVTERCMREMCSERIIKVVARVVRRAYYCTLLVVLSSIGFIKLSSN